MPLGLHLWTNPQILLNLPHYISGQPSIWPNARDLPTIVDVIQAYCLIAILVVNSSAEGRVWSMRGRYDQHFWLIITPFLHVRVLFAKEVDVLRVNDVAKDAWTTSHFVRHGRDWAARHLVRERSHGGNRDSRTVWSNAFCVDLHCGPAWSKHNFNFNFY